MQRRNILRVGAIAAALALLSTGCGDDDDDGDASPGVTEAPAGEGAGGEALAVSLVDFGFEGLPEEIEAGAVELALTNDGEVEHEIAFAEIGDTDIDQFVTDFAPVVEGGGPVPEYLEGFVGANFVEPGGSTTVTYTLEEGTYAAFCTLTGDPENPEAEDEGEGHWNRGMAQVVTVTGGDDAELPEGDGTITAVDYGFEVDVSGGDEVINFTNEGPAQPHFAGFDVYPEGTTAEEAEAAFATLMTLEEDQAPPEGTPEGEEVAFSGVATAGRGIQFEVPGGFEAGRTYVFYCFLSDLSGGPPHAVANEMFKAVTVE